MIYTFYSFKGGVGRSMALANTAEWFYRQGLSVAMVDWDLEAPGLEAFFATDPTMRETLKNQPGLVELLVDYRNRHKTLPRPGNDQALEAERALLAKIPDFPMPPPSKGYRSMSEVLDGELPPLLGSLWPIRKPSPDGDVAGPALWLLPAGNRAPDRMADYGRQVQSLNWTELYDTYDGEAYFEWMRRQLTTLADVVLIDSRTGITEMGGVCARQLADVVVSFCAPNRQNLDGVVDMTASFTRSDVMAARGNRPLQVVVVPTRLDNNEIEHRNDFEQRFRGRLANAPEAFRRLGRDFWGLRIPYVPKYSYQERLVIGAADRAEDLENAYRDLATHLALLAPQGGKIRARCLEPLRKLFGRALPSVSVVGAGAAGRAAARALSGQLEKEGVLVWRAPDAAPEGHPSATASAAGVLDGIEAQVMVLSGDPGATDSLRREWQQARRAGVPTLLAWAPDAPRTPPGDWVDGARIFDPATEWDAFRAALANPPPVRRVPFMVPLRMPAMVPRPALLQQAKTALLGQPKATRLGDKSGARVALCGLGGSGKTVLAHSLCYDDDVAAAFPDGILWVSARDASQLLKQLELLHASLAGEPRTFIDADEGARAIRALAGDRRCLLVVDDATPQTLRAFLELGQQWTVLATMRNLDVAVEYGFVAVQLHAIGRDEGLQLLFGTLPDAPVDDPAAQELVDVLGGLPLALAMANAMLRRRIEFGEDLRRAVRGLVTSLRERGPSAIDQVGAPDATRSLTAMLATTIEGLTPAERDALQAVMQAEDGTLTVGAVAQRMGRPEAETERLFQGLSARGLVRLDLSAGTARMHAAVRGYLRALRPATGTTTTSPAAADQAAGQAIKKEDLVEQARLILLGQSLPAADARDLAKKLIAVTAFKYARLLLERARRDPEAMKDETLGRDLAQRQALATYKDEQLPAEARLDAALEILRSIGLGTTADPETLGQAGAIYKRKWEVGGQRLDLERSLVYYRRACASNVAVMDGWPALNAAFVLDVLAGVEDEEARAGGGQSETSAPRRAEAGKLREGVRAALVQQLRSPDSGQAGKRESYWFVASIAEACFGLRQYDDANLWLERAAQLPDTKDWQRESTGLQLAAILRGQLQQIRARGDSGSAEIERGRAVLQRFLGIEPEAARSTLAGKVGLALSGGGFRASLFHIGVLAHLAERDLLRSVEALSCVSGGSIIGAHYYLELRKLLQTKTDADIRPDDYVDIVKRIEERFVAGVQKNLRMRVPANLFANLKMFFLRSYSRTHRLGELYERHLYRRVDDGEERGPRWLNKLTIGPKDEPDPAAFRPSRGNWRRSAKVPVLILNATTLNTGHSWQFTATWMGESPGSIDTEVDTNDRLRRMYYKEAPKPYQNMRLGHAVAASSCVPGLFEPLAMAKLYPDRVVRLVDGGVHDNQGVVGLLDQDCRVFLVSDASGQMVSAKDVGAGPIGSLLRTNSVLMERVRIAQHQDASARTRSGQLRGLMFVHIKKELDSEPVPWLDCREPADTFYRAETQGGTLPLTSYGIERDVQKRLAAMRTDLDSFSEVEAAALMTSAYRMTQAELARALPAAPPARPQAWRFLEIEKAMRRAGGEGDKHEDLLTQLTVAAQPAFKIWRLMPLLKVIGLVLLAAAIAGMGWAAWVWREQPLLTVGGVGTTAAFALLSAVLGSTVAGLLRFRNFVWRTLIGLGLITAGWLVAWLHLLTFDRLFINQGKLARLGKHRGGAVLGVLLAVVAVVPAAAYFGLLRPQQVGAAAQQFADLEKLSDLLLSKGERVAAEDALERGIVTARAVPRRSLELKQRSGEAAFKLATLHAADGRAHKAIEFYDWARADLADSPPETAAKPLVAKTYLYLNTGDPKLATDSAHEALAVLDKAGEPLLAAAHMHEVISDVKLEDKNLPQARAEAEKAEEIRLRLPARVADLTESDERLGTIAVHQGRWVEAVKRLQRAVKGRDENPGPRSIEAGKARLYLARALVKVGQIDDANAVIAAATTNLPLSDPRSNDLRQALAALRSEILGARSGDR